MVYVPAVAGAVHTVGLACVLKLPPVGVLLHVNNVLASKPVPTAVRFAVAFGAIFPIGLWVILVKSIVVHGVAVTVRQTSAWS